MFREAQKVSFALSEKQKGLCAILVALKFRAEKYKDHQNGTAVYFADCIILHLLWSRN